MDGPRGCELYLAIEAGAGALERLAAAAAAAPVACVLIEGPLPLPADHARALVGATRNLGLPVLLAGDARLARTLRADGVHIPFTDAADAAYAEAREILSAEAMVGVDVGRSRHQAMTLGEAGADYIGFGIPPFVGDRERARERRLALVAWWAEIFEVPCVAFNVDDPAEARSLAEAGADFVAVHIPAAIPVDEARGRVAAFAAAMREVAPRIEEARG